MPNLTFNVADLVGVDFDARRTKVWIEANADPIIDTAGRVIRFGDVKAAVADDGTGVFTGLLATNAAGINPSGFLYQAYVSYVNRTSGERTVWRSGWFALTADSDLALVTPRAPAPPNTTDDEVIASRINDPASATKAALTTSIDGRAPGATMPYVPSPEWGARAKAGQMTLAELHRFAWRELETGALQTRKASYAASVRYAATANTATQKFPGYSSLTAGLGDNTIFTTDKAWLSTVTAVYNLTTDPTRATNLLQTWYRNSQQAVLSVAPTIGDTVEFVGTAVPYQGLWAYTPPANVASTYFEVVDWDESVASTSNGTGGSALASPYDLTPLIAKLPLPNTGSITTDSFLNDSVVMMTNYATVGTDPRGQAQRDIIERNPLVNHDGSSGYYRFRRGLRFYIAGTGTRGAAQTAPQTRFYVNPLGGGAGGWPSKHLNVIHALVRVVDNLVADATTYPIGRLFLMVASRYQTSSGGQAGTESGGASAIDLFALPGVPGYPGNPDYFDGMVTL